MRCNSSLQDLTAVADSLQNVTAGYHACYDLGIFWFESENIPYSRNRFTRYYQITKTLSWGSVALVICCPIHHVGQWDQDMRCWELNGA